MADPTLFPRGKKPAKAVAVGSSDNPVVKIDVVDNTIVYVLADGTTLTAGTIEVTT